MVKSEKPIEEQTYQGVGKFNGAVGTSWTYFNLSALAELIPGAFIGRKLFSEFKKLEEQNKDLEKEMNLHSGQNNISKNELQKHFAQPLAKLEKQEAELIRSGIITGAIAAIIPVAAGAYGLYKGWTNSAKGKKQLETAQQEIKSIRTQNNEITGERDRAIEQISHVTKILEQRVPQQHVDVPLQSELLTEHHPTGHAAKILEQKAHAEHAGHHHS